jgi:MoxR-like ATPase
MTGATTCEPFVVFATQNPIEQEGHFRRPPGSDRFMFKLQVGYPSAEAERRVAAHHAVGPVVAGTDAGGAGDGQEILAARQVIRETFVRTK